MTATKTRFLRGEQCFLRPVEESDIAVLAEWMNDPEVTRLMFSGQVPQSIGQVRSVVDGILGNSANVVFMVCGPANQLPIGFAGLYDIHPRSHRAEFRIIIGEKKSWGRGVGTEVTRLLTFYGFDRLNLHRIWLGFTAENRAARGAYTSAGYHEEGVLKDDIYRNSRYYDTVRMAILRERYYKQYYRKDMIEFGIKPSTKRRKR